MATILDQLKAIPAFSLAVYPVCPHVTTHMTRDALTAETLPLFVEASRIMDTKSGTLRSSVACVRIDTYETKPPTRLDLYRKLRDAIGEGFTLGVGLRPWGTDYGPMSPKWTGEKVAPQWLWAQHLAWIGERFRGLGDLSRSLAYATLDCEAIKDLPLSTRERAGWAMEAEIGLGIRASGHALGVNQIWYRCNSYQQVVPTTVCLWRSDNFYELHDAAFMRSTMRKLGAEDGPKAAWLNLNWFTNRDANGAPINTEGVVTPEMAHRIGSEMFGVGQDEHAPWSKLGAVLWYECMGVNDRWWHNFVAYARGVHGMPLE